jgi:purine-binding chemotaxis protein CheW
MAQVNMKQAEDPEVTDQEALNAGETQQFLTFELGGEVYAINILHIREIIEYGNLTQVPMVPSFIAGVINLRGSVVPVIDLAIRFGKAATKITKRTSIVIIEFTGAEQALEIGIMVDIVNEVLEIENGQIEPAPSFGASIRTDFIAGMGKVDDKFLILLDVERVLSIDELSAVMEIPESTDSIENVTV